MLVKTAEAKMDGHRAAEKRYILHGVLSSTGLARHELRVSTELFIRTG